MVPVTVTRKGMEQPKAQGHVFQHKSSEFEGFLTISTAPRLHRKCDLYSLGMAICGSLMQLGNKDAGPPSNIGITSSKESDRTITKTLEIHKTYMEMH